MVYWPKQRCQGANSDLELWKLLIATYLSEWAPVSQLGQILQRSGVSWSSERPFLPFLWEMEVLVQQKPGCWNLLLAFSSRHIIHLHVYHMAPCETKNLVDFHWFVLLQKENIKSFISFGFCGLPFFSCFFYIAVWLHLIAT